jgi:acetyl-CoA carboxylase biotin carboxyl carrier protein
MNLEEIKELIALMRKHRISEIDLEQKGSKVRIVAESSRPQVAEPAPAAPMPTHYYLAPGAEAVARPQAAPAPAPQAPAPQPAPEAEPAQEKLPSNLLEVKSPMVGTFYRAPAPDAPPYVEVGSSIHKDSVLCIIEAMKLMNEIKAEVQGRIVKVLVENGQPVEYNQPLFLVEP